MDIKEKVRGLPGTPGVYIMKDGSGGVLYVGKAANLRKRVSSYFYAHSRLQARLEMMVRQVKDIEYLPASTEAEALIYENGLIKQLSPKYNVSLRDDKSYPMLKLTVNERFPRLFITRQKRDDGALYYGPYTSAKLLKEALIILKQTFPLRSCARMPKSVCLNYHIKQCFAPCAGYIDEAGYHKMVAELKLFLEGRRAELVDILSRHMQEAASREDFEEAARLKGRIEALSSIREGSVHYAPAGEVEELGAILGLSAPPESIEAFDISDIMGSSAVGSMVSFYKGRPKKNAYRKFRIKGVTGMDDYAMMREVVSRHYDRLTREKLPLPDLIVIDGGKGHLSVVVDELERMGLSEIPAVGIAKEFEHIYKKDKVSPIVLPKESKALHLLKRIRDEAHRFAIIYHKNLLSKKVGGSELDGISGIGRKRKRALLGHFGSAARVGAANMEDLLKVKGIDEKSARNIITYFKRRAS